MKHESHSNLDLIHDSHDNCIFFSYILYLWWTHSLLFIDLFCNARTKSLTLLSLNTINNIEMIILIFCHYATKTMMSDFKDTKGNQNINMAHFSMQLCIILQLIHFFHEKYNIFEYFSSKKRRKRKKNPGNTKVIVMIRVYHWHHPPLNSIYITNKFNVKIHLFIFSSPSQT